MAKLIINGENAVLGRLCSYVAKSALEGNEIVILNSEKVVVSGNKKDVLDKFRKRRARGGYSRKGPHYPKDPERVLKRAIRGMLPDYRMGNGKLAFSRIKCYNGIPKEFESEKIAKFKITRTDAIQLKEISEKI